jgi:hypothetical protein
LSDFDGDDRLDLAIGNDFVQPDLFYRGDGTGAFREIVREDQVIPSTAWFTMSIDTADFNNDLRLDMFIVGIAKRGTGKAAQVKARGLDQYCSDLTDPKHKAACARNVRTRGFYRYTTSHKLSDIKNCQRLKDKTENADCMAMMLMKTAVREREQSLCQYILKFPGDHERTDMLCNNYFAKSVNTTQAEYLRAIPQVQNRNMLLVAAPDGTFVERAVEMNVDIAGWAWNGKFADLDNDEWQDIYVVNGVWLRVDDATSNYYFSNQQGQNFIDKTDQFGLGDFMSVSAYVYVDFDNDGDLDIVTNTINGPLKVFVNNESVNNSIAVDLRDHRGNRFGIGAKIVIHYGAIINIGDTTLTFVLVYTSSTLCMLYWGC